MDKKGRAEKRMVGQEKRTAIVLLKSMLFAFLVSILVVLCGSVFVSGGVIPEQCIGGSVALACVLGSSVGGAYGIKRIRRKTLVVGVGVGLLLFVFLSVMGTLCNEGEIEWGNGSAMILGSCLCGGGISGVLGSASVSKRR